jgi:5-methylcytosine-specific restriction protein A
MKLRALRPRIAPLAPRFQPSATPRITGRPLQRIRAEHFARHPLCVACEAEGRTTPATELDHVVPLFRGGRDDDTNRQGLCAECHAAKTLRDLREW